MAAAVGSREGPARLAGEGPEDELLAGRRVFPEEAEVGVLGAQYRLQRLPQSLRSRRLGGRGPLPEEVAELLGRVGMATGQRQRLVEHLRLDLPLRLRRKRSTMKAANGSGGIGPRSIVLALRQNGSLTSSKIRAMTWRLLPR